LQVGHVKALGEPVVYLRSHQLSDPDMHNDRITLAPKPPLQVRPKAMRKREKR
jgi:hypothetical protein